MYKNKAESGAGFWMNSDSNNLILDSIFKYQNKVVEYSAGIYIRESQNVTIKKTVSISNKAETAGGSSIVVDKLKGF